MKPPGVEPDPDKYAKLFKPEFTGPLAVWCAAIASIFVVIVFVIVFSVGGSNTDALRNLSAAFAPFIAVMVAGATFATVLWRGSISIEQNVQAKRQNDSKEEADLGLLLEKGHEHTAKGTANDIALGIAMLDTVARAENDKYASYALHEIARQLKPCFLMNGSDRERVLSLIREVFERLASDDQKRHRKPTTIVDLDFDSDELKGTRLSIFPHMPACVLRGGHLAVGPDETVLLNDKKCQMTLVNCEIRPGPQQSLDGLEELVSPYYIETVTSTRFVNCLICNFNIGSIGEGIMSDVPEATFLSCDLSNTEICSRAVFASCTFLQSYFVEDRPPRLSAALGPQHINFEPDPIDIETLEGVGIFPWQKLMKPLAEELS